MFGTNNAHLRSPTSQRVLGRLAVIPCQLRWNTDSWEMGMLTKTSLWSKQAQKKVSMEPKGVDRLFWLKTRFIFYHPGHFFCLSIHFHSIEYFAMTWSQSNSREKNKPFSPFAWKNVVNDFKKSIIPIKDSCLSRGEGGQGDSKQHHKQNDCSCHSNAAASLWSWFNAAQLSS